MKSKKFNKLVKVRFKNLKARVNETNSVKLVLGSNYGSKGQRLIFNNLIFFVKFTDKMFLGIQGLISGCYFNKGVKFNNTGKRYISKLGNYFFKNKVSKKFTKNLINNNLKKIKLYNKR